MTHVTQKTNHQVVLMEYERGWGSRVDEILYFETQEDAEQYVKNFNSVNKEETVPNWYMTATYSYLGE